MLIGFYKTFVLSFERDFEAKRWPIKVAEIANCSLAWSLGESVDGKYQQYIRSQHHQ